MPSRVALDDQVSERIVEMYNAGEKLLDITKETGVPRASIYWVLQKAGIQPGRMPKPSGEMMSVHEVLDRLRAADREVGELREKLRASEGYNLRLLEQMDELRERTRPPRPARGTAKKGVAGTKRVS